MRSGIFKILESKLHYTVIERIKYAYKDKSIRNYPWCALYYLHVNVANNSGCCKPQHSSLIGNASTVSTQESPYGWAARGPRASKLPEPEKIRKQQFVYGYATAENNTCFLVGIFACAYFSFFSLLFSDGCVKCCKFLVSFFCTHYHLITMHTGVCISRHGRA